MRIVTFGDSVTVGERDGVAPEETYSYLLEIALRENGRQVQVIRSGVRGENTAMALQRLPEVLDLRPDYLTIMYGLNDAAVDAGKNAPRVSLAEYSRNLEAIVFEARAVGVVPILMTPNPICSFGVTEQLYGSREPYLSNGINFLVALYANAVREIGHKTGTPVLDVYGSFHDRAEDEKFAPFLTDGMHPNPAGHRMIAQIIARHFTQK